MSVADGVQQFVEFGKRVKGFLINLRTGNSTTAYGRPPQEFGEDLFESYNDSHLYQVEESTKMLLMLTKPPMSNKFLRLPFKNMFIGCHFTREEIEKYFGTTIEYEEIFGMLLQEGVLTMLDKSGEKKLNIEAGHSLKVIACCEKIIPNGKREVVFNTMHINVDFDKDLEITKVLQVSAEEAKNTKKFCKIFVMNLLNLIHDPEIEIVTRTRDNIQNEKRIKKGKSAIPASTIIKLTGKRKIYVDSLIAGDSFRYSHRFWVRGFYRHLKSDKFKNAKQMDKFGMGRGVIWVMPFQKGDGILIQKDYDVEVDNRGVAE